MHDQQISVQWRVGDNNFCCSVNKARSPVDGDWLHIELQELPDRWPTLLHFGLEIVNLSMVCEEQSAVFFIDKGSVYRIFHCVFLEASNRRTVDFSSHDTVHYYQCGGNALYQNEVLAVQLIRELIDLRLLVLHVQLRRVISRKWNMVTISESLLHSHLNAVLIVPHDELGRNHCQ